MSDDESKKSSGCGATVLALVLVATVVLIILKMTGVIDWAWVAVLSPVIAYLVVTLASIVCVVIAILLIVIAFIIVMLFILGIVFGITIFDKIKELVRK